MSDAKRERLYLTTSKVILDELEAMSEHLGMERSQLGTVALDLGLRVLRDWSPAAPVSPKAVPFSLRRAPLGTPEPSSGTDQSLESTVVQPSSTNVCGAPRALVLSDDVLDEDDDVISGEGEDDGEDPDLERAVAVLFERQQAKRKITDPKAYKASIRAELRASPGRIAKLLGSDAKPKYKIRPAGLDPV